MVARALFVVMLLGLTPADGLMSAGANPIRKVVTLMQNMQKEIEETGKKEKELFDKFMCYCSGNGGELAKSIEDGKARIEELTARQKAEAAEKSQTEQDLIGHKKDREDATKDLEEAKVIRDKEAAEYAETKADDETNIKAMAGAIPALESGMGGASFVQTEGAGQLKRIAESFPFSDEMDRRSVVAFLEQSGDYVPQSGQIVGILKNMKDEIEADLAKATTGEEQAIAGFAELKKSKEEQVAAAAKAIETKQTRAGELAVSVVQVADDLEDTTNEVADSEKFAKQLEEQCGVKEKEWAAREELRSQEIAAISDAIGMLNDDDALDLFKKAMPSSLLEQKAGFLQRSSNQARPLQKAQAILSQLTQKSEHSKIIKLMLFTLHSKLNSQAKQRSRDGRRLASAGGFEEVTKMVDDMVEIEGKEQEADDKKKPWCNTEFDKSDREEKTEKTEITSLEAEIDADSDAIQTINDEIAALKSEIAELDKAVVEATEQRKDEHEDYVEGIQLSSTAVELVKKARNRLQKFYNPTLYKAAPVKAEMTMEEKIIDAGSALGQLHQRSDVAPPPPPETFGAYEKASGKSSGVLALMDNIVKELEGDMKDAEHDEKVGQKDYEELMTESAEARSAKVKGVTDKEAAKAGLRAKKTTEGEQERADFKDVDGILQYRQTLHGECDFITENYDARKEARTQEIESLKSAKAVLAGAELPAPAAQTAETPTTPAP